MPPNYSSIQLYTVVEAMPHLQAAPQRLLILDSRALILHYRNERSMKPGLGGTSVRKAEKNPQEKNLTFPELDIPVQPKPP